MTQRAGAVVAVALLAVVWSAAPAQAAAPRLVMVGGAPLAPPILLSDWDEIATLTGLLSSGPAAPSDPRGGRPSLQLALVDLPWAGTWPKRVGPDALAILVRHGVPTRLGGSGVSIPRSGGAGIPVT